MNVYYISSHSLRVTPKHTSKYAVQIGSNILHKTHSELHALTLMPLVSPLYPTEPKASSRGKPVTTDHCNRSHVM